MKTVSIRNITITVDEEVAKWARVWAAQHDTSVSKLVGKLLQERMMLELKQAQAQKRFLSRKPRALKTAETQYPTRSDLYER